MTFTYQQLAADLTDRISAGEYSVGSVLPNVRSLADAYAVDLGTVRRALHQLAADGVVELNLQAIVSQR